MKYAEHLDKAWKAAFSVVSRFSRRKAMSKGKDARKPFVVAN